MDSLLVIISLGVGFYMGYVIGQRDVPNSVESVRNLLKTNKLKILKKRVPVPPEVEAVEELEKKFQ
jgi:hypothetical protein